MLSVHNCRIIEYCKNIKMVGKSLLSLVFFIAVCNVSCKFLLFPKEQLLGIPGQADLITVSSTEPTDSLFAKISKSLVKSGWLLSSSREGLQISAESKPMPYKMYIRPIIHVVADGVGSKAIFKGMWSRRPQRENYVDYVLFTDTNEIRRIKWGGYRTDDGAAFQNLMLLAKKTTGVSKFEFSKSK